MQETQDQREINDDKFKKIDERWSIVKDAFRIQQKERKEDISALKDKLHERVSVSQTLEKSKAKTISDNLSTLLEEAEVCKQNINGYFEYQSKFRINHLEKKNAFIQSYNESGDAFNDSTQKYVDSKIGQIANRIQAIDINKREKTADAVKTVKDVAAKQGREFMNSEKTKYQQLMGKVTTDVNKQLKDMRNMMGEYLKKKDQSDTKLQYMIGNLTAELQKLFEEQTKEGEITYDCLLKVIEDSCSKIQQAQFK